jgi:hypothetical protein
MTPEQKNYRLPYSIMMLAVGIAMLGWAIPYGFANYRFDQCSESLQARIGDLQAKIDGAKGALEQK